MLSSFTNNETVSADELSAAFRKVSDSYVGFQVVVMPPTWRPNDLRLFTFVIFEEELARPQLHRFFEVSIGLGIENPRPVSRRLLELASILHPLFFSSFKKRCGLDVVHGPLDDFSDRLSVCRLTATESLSVNCSPIQFYLQSLLFLAGCTLSAAVVQSRFSLGTIESKLNRLWQAAQYAKRFGYMQLAALNLDEFVIELARNKDTPVSQLIQIKKAYGQALAAIHDTQSVELKTVTQENLTQADKDRFGFIDDLRQVIGANLLCVLSYGSSVTSIDFHDFDLVLIVKDAAAALERLSGTSPSYRNKEINLSIYDSDDFTPFQTMSGDNLNHNARCLFGETQIPIKSPYDLMLRNFSFAFIRLRQLLGMAGYLSKQKTHGGLQDATNLYEYFVKIPMHIMKGVRSVAHEPISKEYINSWTSEALGYDLNEQLLLLKHGRVTEAISNAYLATHDVISHLNLRYQIFKEENAVTAAIAE
jgi:hypothetical protein